MNKTENDTVKSRSHFERRYLRRTRGHILHELRTQSKKRLAQRAQNIQQNAFKIFWLKGEKNSEKVLVQIWDITWMNRFGKRQKILFTLQ